jgi:hypothetical protein
VTQFLVSFSFLVPWGGVRLSPLGTSATNWPIVPAPDDSWWVWSSRWNENWEGKPKYSEKTCPSVTLSTTNPTWPNLGSKPGRRGGKPATNRLSYGKLLVNNLNMWKTLTVPFLCIQRNKSTLFTKSKLWEVAVSQEISILCLAAWSQNYFDNSYLLH